MSTEPINPYAYQPDSESNRYGEPERPRSKWATCLMGCLVVLGIVVVLSIVVGIWIAQNLRGWAADFGLEVINKGVDASDLPPQEKVEVKAQAERVAKAIRNDEITNEQAMAIIEKLAQSPLMPSLIVLAVDKQYFDRSGLSGEEKAQGRDALRRFARGAMEGKIDQQGIDAVLSHVADRKGDNEWQFRPQVSDAELRAAISDAKSRADQAGVSIEAESTIDPSDEVKRIIDEALQEKK